MKLCKIFIPKDNAQPVTEVESYTVSWLVSTSLVWKDYETFNKVFINKNDAEEFKKQLEESAKFIKTKIKTGIVRN